jgi:hypothetical protein
VSCSNVRMKERGACRSKTRENNRRNVPRRCRRAPGTEPGIAARGLNNKLLPQEVSQVPPLRSFLYKRVPASRPAQQRSERSLPVRQKRSPRGPSMMKYFTSLMATKIGEGLTGEVCGIKEQPPGSEMQYMKCLVVPKSRS